MKILIVLAFLILPFNFISSQNKIELTFKDGTILSGFGKIKGNDKIRFSTTKDGDTDIYDYEKVAKIKVTNKKNETEKFEFKSITNSKGKTNNILLKELITGKTSLYVDYASYWTFNANTAIGQTGMGTATVLIYYIQVNLNETITELGPVRVRSKKFRESAATLFKDCPQLIKKLENKDFKNSEITEVVEFYNGCN